MENYKKEFIKFLLDVDALHVGGDFTLKSKRISPWFVNVGDFNDGNSISALGRFYAEALINSEENFDILYGIPEKGNALVVATAIALAEKEKNIPWFFTRKTPKKYGEASELPEEDKKIKELVIGRVPKNGQIIAQLDDVFTAGDAKYEARKTLQSIGNFELPALVIAVDRQEVGVDGKSAIKEYEAQTGTKVISIVNASEIYQFLKEREIFPLEKINRMSNYLRLYGPDAVKNVVGKLEQKIIDSDRSVIPACDVETLEKFELLIKQTANIKGIGGYKIGFELGLNYGLPKVVEVARNLTDKPLIYDHQKAGTDIPDTGKNFAKVVKKAGVDAVILFPQAGPETERAWIYHALDNGLKVIVGGRMTHPAYTVSEGGFITDEGALEIYRIAARAGINDFVVPGNKPEVIKKIREVVETEGADPIFYAPGFIAQGGSISDSAKVAGDKFHGIVGRGIYEKSDMRQAAIEHTSQLN